VKVRGGSTGQLECMQGYCTKLRIHVSGQAGIFTYLLTYKPKTELRSCGLYKSTELPINQSINCYIITYYNLHRPILRTRGSVFCTRICGAVHTDLRGIVYDYRAIAYSFSGFVCLYIYGLSGLKSKETIGLHMK